MLAADLGSLDSRTLVTREGILSVQCWTFWQVYSMSRWIWHHSIEDAVFKSWAPGYPRSDNSHDDCAILNSSNGYKWTDIRFVYSRNPTFQRSFCFFKNILQLRNDVWITNMPEGLGI